MHDSHLQHFVRTTVRDPDHLEVDVKPAEMALLLHLSVAIVSLAPKKLMEYAVRLRAVSVCAHITKCILPSQDTITLLC